MLHRVGTQRPAASALAIPHAQLSAPQPSYFGIERSKAGARFSSSTRSGTAGSVLPKPRSAAPAVELKVRAKEATNKQGGRVLFHGVHHVALLCDDLDRSMEFYTGVLGLEVNPDRPHDKLPYPGAWLWIGPEMIHLMQLPNPDPLEGRPTHGGRDRHFCVGVQQIAPLEERLKAAGVEYTRSMSGRPALFFRDPDANTLEVVEQQPWR